MTGTISRRAFLGGVGATALAVGAGSALAGCSPQENSSSSGAETSDGQAAESGVPDPIDEASISSTEAYDVVVIGAGAAGLAAAASAAEEGAKVICLEKLDASAGMGTYYGFINTDLLKENGVAEVDEDDYANRLIEANLDATDPALIRNYVSHSAKVGNWLAEAAGGNIQFSNAMGSKNTACFDDSTEGMGAYDR